MIIAHLSDPHIAEGRDEPSIQLSRAVAHILALPARPDVVVVTGDCVENGLPSEYEQFRALLRPLPMPVYVVPGNHDHRAHLLAAFGAQGATPLDGFVQYAVDDWPVRLLALDTHIPGQGAGVLCATREAWLRERLAEQPSKPTIVMMHHPPFLTGLAPADRISLQNIDQFEALVADFGQVDRVIAGHIHAAATRRFARTLAMTCAAMGQQLVCDFNTPEQLRVQLQPPSCLLHVWSERTGLVTHTSNIGEHGETVTLHDGTRWM